MPIRRADEAEISTILDWADAEGWNPGIDDIGPFMAADPGGFWVSEVEGKVAAALSLVHHSPDFAFLGFYMAAPSFRGRGLGYALWQHALSQNAARTIGLDGVVAQQENYRRSGFVYAHANWRYRGAFAAERFRPDLSLLTPTATMMADLVNYDSNHNPAARPNFIMPWLEASATRRSLVAVENGGVVGLGTIRTCRDGHKIGPLFAQSAEIAERLFTSLTASVGGGAIYLDIPGPSVAAKALCEKFGMEPVFETARMYRGAMPTLPLDRIFGITTFELG